MNEPRLRFHKEDGNKYPDWKTVVFGSIMISLSNNTLSRSELSSDGCIKNIHYGDILIKYPSILDASCHDIPFIKDENKIKAKKEAFLRTGDIVIADTAEDETVGKAVELFVHDEHVLAGLHTMAFRPVKRLFWPGFLGYYINSPAYHNSLRVLMQGIKVTSISKSEIVKTTISVPLVEEQHKIADFLSMVDEKISLKQNKYDALVEAKKGLLQKIFSREIRFRRDDGREYPEWACVALGDIANLYNGYAFKSSTYDSSGQYNIITIANVTGDKYISLDEKTNKISSLPDNIVSHQILKQNDILISMTGNVGRVSLNIGNHNLLNQRVGLLRTTESNSYVYYAIANDMFRNAMVEKGQGGAQPNIKKDDILNYEIQLPCKYEQQKIAEFLSSFDEKIDAVKKELEGWKTVKKGLLQQMFC